MTANVLNALREARTRRASRRVARPGAGLLERLLVRWGVLATPAEDTYFAWADQRLDEVAAIERRLRGDRRYQAHPMTDDERRAAHLRARGYRLVAPSDAEGDDR